MGRRNTSPSLGSNYVWCVPMQTKELLKANLL
jgi:hypothetical protein